MFSVDERLEQVRSEISALDAEIEVVPFDSLLMDFAESQGATIIVRGLRAVADFVYEFQMAGMNQQLTDRVETVFMIADVAIKPIASWLVMERGVYGGEWKDDEWGQRGC